MGKPPPVGMGLVSIRFAKIIEPLAVGASPHRTILLDRAGVRKPSTKVGFLIVPVSSVRSLSVGPSTASDRRRSQNEVRVDKSPSKSRSVPRCTSPQHTSVDPNGSINYDQFRIRRIRSTRPRACRFPRCGSTGRTAQWDCTSGRSTWHHPQSC